MPSKKKATPKPLWTSSVKLVKPPYLRLVGPQLSIHSGWWTAGFGEADESVGELSLCQVLEVDEHREAQIGVKEVMFKIALVTSKDPHLDGEVMAEYESKREAHGAAAAASSAAAAAAAAAPAAAPAATAGPTAVPAAAV